jgi:hypothetical protein
MGVKKAASTLAQADAQLDVCTRYSASRIHGALAYIQKKSRTMHSRGMQSDCPLETVVNERREK